MAKVGAVILAAGESSRLGRPKQLVQVGGKTLVRRAVDSADGAKCSPIIVIVGDQSSDIERELQRTNAVVVRNENWKCGIGTSIRCGVQHLIGEEKDIDAVALLVCDQPFVSAAIVEALIARRTQTGKAIVASSYSNTLGVPAIFDRSLFPQLLALSDASGAKPLILQNRDKVAQLPFPEGKIDIDKGDELERLA